MVKELGMLGSEDVLSFWLDEHGTKGWYKSSDALDTEIRNRFLSAWKKAVSGGFGQWLTHPSGALAYIILTDQFARNMFRGTAKAFASDRISLSAAKLAIDKGWDLKIDEPARLFFYMPLMHSENLCDQERCVRLIWERLPGTGEGALLHARAHREVIRKFGRFPYRNEALGRVSTGAETHYVENGGYGRTVRELQAAAAA